MKKIALSITAGSMADLITEIEDLLLEADGPMSITQLIKKLSPNFQQSLGLVGLTTLLKQSDFKVDVHKNTVYLPAGYVGTSRYQAGMTADLVAGVKSYLKRVKECKDSIGNIYRNLERKLRDYFNPENIENILKTLPDFEVDHPIIKWNAEGETASVAFDAKSALAKLQKALVPFCKQYYPNVPIAALGELAKDVGLILIDDDGTEWEGILTGREGRAKLEVGIFESSAQEGQYKSTGKFIALQWYKMPSGKFEINAYLA